MSSQTRTYSECFIKVYNVGDLGMMGLGTVKAVWGLIGDKFTWCSRQFQKCTEWRKKPQREEHFCRFNCSHTLPCLHECECLSVCQGHLPHLMELICYATNESIEENLHNKFTSSRGQQREEEHLTLFHELLAQRPTLAHPYPTHARCPFTASVTAQVRSCTHSYTFV